MRGRSCAPLFRRNKMMNPPDVDFTCTECAKCCHAIDDSLAKAIDEHDKLMAKPGMPMPAKK